VTDDAPAESGLGPLQRFLHRAAALFPVMLAVVVVIIAGVLAAWCWTGSPARCSG
jgi:hypothetical protein